MEYWALLYLYTDSIGHLSAEIHELYDDPAEAERIRKMMINPTLYFVRRVRVKETIPQ